MAGQTTQTADNFGVRLDLALKVLNISRVQLAAMVGVDKSLVSRWVSAQVTPTAHNMMRISEVLAKTRPGFNAMQWERPLGEFRAFLGLTPSTVKAGVSADAVEGSDGLTLRSLEMSAREAAATGQVYTGLYALFRYRFKNTGVVHLELLRVYRDEDGLRWELTDGGNRTNGVFLILRGKPHLLGEGDSGKDGLTLHILNGTGDTHAMVMDGLLCSVSGDRFFTPSACKVVLLRIAHPLEDEAADRTRLTGANERAGAINNAAKAVDHLPAEFSHALDNRDGFVRAKHFTLRIPFEDTVARSDFEAANYDFPSPALVQAILGDG